MNITKVDGPQLKSPILFLIYNRPDLTQKVFEQIRMARPEKLYVSADGPSEYKKNDYELCTQSRLVLKTIDWPCQVMTLFREANLGCKNAIADGIDWFFENENEGIILEDDCLPVPDFFSYCQTLLEHYREDTRIHVISGTRPLDRPHEEASYGFSKLISTWGWASWRRAWKMYDRELSAYSLATAKKTLASIFSDKLIVSSWVEILKKLHQGKIDTWDYQLAIVTLFNSAFCIIPSVNLVSNEGFRTDATHTFDRQNPYSKLTTGELKIIKHPLYIVANKTVDEKSLRKALGIDSTINRLKRRIKSTLRYLQRRI